MSNKLRVVIFHVHLFKNAGTSLDASFKSYFGEKWITKEFEGNNDNKRKEVERWIIENPDPSCFSSHTAVFPLPQIDGVEIIPVIFIRNPIDRIASAYSFERKTKVSNLGAVLARNTTLKGYVEVRLAMGNDFQCRNFQARRLATMYDGNEELLLSAVKAIKSLPFIGIVEQFSQSLVRLESILASKGFDDIQLNPVEKNVSRSTKNSLDEKIEEIRERLGEDIFNKLVEVNQADLTIWELLNSRS